MAKIKKDGVYITATNTGDDAYTTLILQWPDKNHVRITVRGIGEMELDAGNVSDVYKDADGKDVRDVKIADSLDQMCQFEGWDSKKRDWVKFEESAEYVKDHIYLHDGIRKNEDNKIVIFGNPDELKVVRERINLRGFVGVSDDTFFEKPGCVLFTDDYDFVHKLAGNNGQTCFIGCVIDRNNPIDLKGHNAVRSLNTFSSMLPGEAISDCVVYTDEKGAYDRLQKQIDSFIEMNRVLQNIKDEKLKVVYDGFSFGGGREPDFDCFKLMNGGKEAGTVRLEHMMDSELPSGSEVFTSLSFEAELMSDGVDYCNSGWNERKNVAVYETMKNVVMDAFARDDKEVYDYVIDDDKSICVADYNDISRKDIVSLMKQSAGGKYWDDIEAGLVSQNDEIVEPRKVSVPNPADLPFESDFTDIQISGTNKDSDDHSGLG